jgi:hypothetical protein
MKLKTIILLSLVFAVSGTVFGQQTDSVKPAAKTPTRNRGKRGETADRQASSR